MALDPKIRDLVLAFAKDNKCDVLIFNGPCYPALDQEALPKLRKRQQDAARPKNAVWVITTPGGVPENAYRMCRAIQLTYEKTTALVGGWCKSAGTLCVIAANEIAMADEAELGPLDVQLARRDELDERDSGLVINEALECLEVEAFKFFDSFMRQIKDGTHGLVTLKMASEISANVTKGLFEPIYRQIDPQKMGEIARSMAVGEAYALRLNMKTRSLKANALQSLIQGYPSHGFVIDREEAAYLFRSIRRPTDSEYQMLKNLGKIALHPSEQPSFEIVTPEEAYAVPPQPTSSKQTPAAKSTANSSKRASSAAAGSRASNNGRSASARTPASKKAK
ncbi:SDH family Clp fold serine proteinase [Acidovorax sp. M14]|uniref:SDH family Clp fold serine proteinase n=1 Tax=Acidovorax sp. M14 TaxID=3411354 RepID=UPI003BF4A62A